MGRTIFFGVLAVLVVIGCQGSSTSDNSATGNTATTPPATTTTAPATTAAATGGYAQVQQIFNKNCVACHGAAKPRGGINLTSYEAVMKGGEEGPIVKAGDPENSVLVQALHGTHGKKQMPMKAPPLPADQIKTIEDWIKAGAKQS